MPRPGPRTPRAATDALGSVRLEPVRPVPEVDYQRHVEHEPVVHLQQEQRKVDAASVGVGEDTLHMLRAIGYIGDED